MSLNLNPSQKLKREPFTWLFVAHFADGTTLEQTQEDKCTTRTDGTGSAFSDVLVREDELIGFSLVHVNRRDVVSLNLKNGIFIINGVPIVTHNQNFQPEKYPLKLVYFRETRVDSVGEYNMKENAGAGKYTAQRHYVNRYFIGWETMVNKKNKQVTLAVG